MAPEAAAAVRALKNPKEFVMDHLHMDDITAFLGETSMGSISTKQKFQSSSTTINQMSSIEEQHYEIFTGILFPDNQVSLKKCLEASYCCVLLLFDNVPLEIKGRFQDFKELVLLTSKTIFETKDSNRGRRIQI